MQSKSLTRSETRAVGENIARIMPMVIQGIHLDFVARHPITHRQFLMLVAIHSHGRCGMNRLSKDLHVAMPTATGIIDRLVRAGYVRRSSDPDDRRQVFIELTDKGARFIRDFQGAVASRWAELLGSFPAADVRRFSRVIDKIVRTLAVLVLALGLGTAHAADSRPLSLSEAILLAAERPVEMIVADERVRESLAQLGQAQSLFVPKVDASLAQSRQTRNLSVMGIPSAGESVVGPFESFEAKVRARQIVLDASAVMRLLAVIEGTRLSKAEKRKAREDAMALVGTMYLEASLSRQRVLFTTYSLELARASLSIAHRRLRSGQSTKSGLFEAKAEWKRARSRSTLARADLAERLRGLAVTLGWDPETRIELAPDDGIERAVVLEQEEIALLLEGHPDIESARSALKQRSQVRRAQWAEYFPKFSLLAEYGAAGSDPSDAEEVYLLGIEGSLPLFDGGERASKAREAEAKERQSAAQLAHTEKKSKAGILDGQQRLIAAEQRLEAEELAVLASRRRKAEIDRRAELGTASAWDRLYGGYRLEESALSHREAGVQYLLSLIALLRAEGRMERLALQGARV